MSIDIRRTEQGIVVTASGRRDGDAEALLHQVVTDLVVGQGNRAVTLDTAGLVAAERATAGAGAGTVAGDFP